MSASAQLNSIGRPAQLKAELRSETSPNRQPRWLTDAVASVVHAERGLVKVIAAALGVRDGAVYEVADSNAPHSLKAWWIPTICRETTSLAILEALAEQCGAAVFKLPTVANPQHAEIVAQAARAMREVAEALEAVGASISDGTITDTERREIERQIADAHAELATLRAVVAMKALAA